MLGVSLFGFNLLSIMHIIRVVQEVVDRLNDGLHVDIHEIPIITVGVIFKHFLRTLPDSLFPLSLYDGLPVVGNRFQPHN
jgi:hypothetical protein